MRRAASFVSQIISMGILIGSVSHIMTRYISMDILRAGSWNSYIKLLFQSYHQLIFWEYILDSLNMKQLNGTGFCSMN